MKQTLFEDELDNIFLKSLKDTKRPFTTKIALKSDFLICISNSKKKYKNFFLELQDNFIFLKKEEIGKEIAFMDINNVFMKINENIIINKKKYFSIKFIKKETYEEIFSKNEKIIKKWYNELKKFCILTKFRCFFTSKKVLGKGSYAKVFLVERIKDKKEFAVKVFSKKMIMENQHEKDCLKYEIKMLRSVNNEKIIKLEEMYEGENFFYILCEFYRGNDLLNSIIKKGSQPEKKCLTIILQILQGLNYLHKHKIIHRDIKPQNIIFKYSQEKKESNITLKKKYSQNILKLDSVKKKKKYSESIETDLDSNLENNSDKKNKIKKLKSFDIDIDDIKNRKFDKFDINNNFSSLEISIVDLGFATFEKDYKKLFKRCGTPGFVAPEILKDKNYDCKSDIFSVGIIFFMILTGKIPFKGKNYSEIVSKNKKGFIDFSFLEDNKNYSIHTINLLKEMLAVNPKKRISAEEAINSECFQTILSKSPLLSRISFINSEKFIQHDIITKNNDKKKFNELDQIGRIEDLEPSPMVSKKSKGSKFSNEERVFTILDEK